jgi:hypothetical protein
VTGHLRSVTVTRSSRALSISPYEIEIAGGRWTWHFQKNGRHDGKGRAVSAQVLWQNHLPGSLPNFIPRLRHFDYKNPAGSFVLLIGPVQAGENLGEIKVGPFLETSGEIRGTPAELQAFAAKWEQPQPVKRGNGEHEWEYAESAKLETRLDGDKLTFHLTDLRPGKLRIVSRFKNGGKPVSHAYSKREPNEDDVVFEIDLQDSRDNLVVTSKK